MNKAEYGPIEAIYGETKTGGSYVAVRDGQVEPNSVFGKPDQSGISYIGFMIDAAGDFRAFETPLAPEVEKNLGE